MLSEAFALAFLTTWGFMMVYKKLPVKVRKFMERHSLATDIVSLVFTYWFLGGTLTALFAGALVGIFTSILLEIANNPEDYIILYDLRDYIKKLVSDAKESLTNLCQQYKEEKANVVQEQG